MTLTTLLPRPDQAAAHQRSSSLASKLYTGPTPASRVPAALLRSPIDVEVVIPSYNEEGRLPATLTEVTKVLAGLKGVTTRVVIVDNSSSDRTAEIVDRFADTDGPEVVVIGCSTKGKGAAVRRGITTSRATIVGFIDADLSVPAQTIATAVAVVSQGNEVVIASRRCEGARYEVKQPRFRRVGSWGFRSAIASLVPDVADSQCGFKFFSLAAARRIFNDMDVVGFAFDVELLMRAARHGYHVTELPVTWTDDVGSSLGLATHAPEIARDIFRLHRIDAALERRTRFAPSRTRSLDERRVQGVDAAFAAVHAARTDETVGEREHERAASLRVVA